MSIRMKCSGCGNIGVTDECNIGKKAQCHNCNTLFEIIPLEEEKESAQLLSTDSAEVKKEQVDEKGEHEVSPSEKERKQESEENKEEQNEEKKDQDIQQEGAEVKSEYTDTHVFTPNHKFEEIEMRPNLMSFVLLSKPSFFALMLITLICFISLFFTIWNLMFFIPFSITTFIYFIFIKIAYEKEKYTLGDTKIIYQYGTLFSDNTVEIHISKITQVGVHLGFIEQKLFQTGSLVIKTAGSSNSKIIFKAIDTPMHLYQEIQTRMQANGFQLKKQHLVQTQKPHILGVLGESIKGMVINIVWFVYFGFILLTDTGEESARNPQDMRQPPDTDLAQSDLIIGGVIIGIIFAIVVIKFILRYYDIKRRVYEIYDDSVFFSEGFLSKNYSFLPLESIADAENNQSFLSKVFGIHDVVISSEGSNNQVFFYNMVNGQKMMETIKYLKQQFAFGTSKDTLTASSKLSSGNSLRSNINFNRGFATQYQPDMQKTVLKNLIYLLPIVTIPIFIIQLIKARCSNFSVGETSFDYKFQFLSAKHNSFSIDKITQIIFYESILDTLIGTCSIEIRSIGSTSAMKFHDIKKQEGMIENILSKIGIYHDHSGQQLDVSFGFFEWIKGNMGKFLIVLCLLIFLFYVLTFIGLEALNDSVDDPMGFESELFLGVFVLFAFGGVLGIVGAYFYQTFYYSQRFYQQTLYKNFVESVSGVLIQSKKYVHLTQIKAIECKKYPFTTTGTILLDVSGDSKVQYGKKSNQFQIVPLGIKIPFIKDGFDMIEHIDEQLHGIPIDISELTRKKQDIGNSIAVTFGILFVCLLFFAEVPNRDYLLLSLGGLSIAFVIWYVKSKLYSYYQPKNYSIFLNKSRRKATAKIGCFFCLNKRKKRFKKGQKNICNFE